MLPYRLLRKIKDSTVSRFSNLRTHWPYVPILLSTMLRFTCTVRDISRFIILESQQAPEHNLTWDSSPACLQTSSQAAGRLHCSLDLGGTPRTVLADIRATRSNIAATAHTRTGRTDGNISTSAQLITLISLTFPAKSHQSTHT